MKLFRDWLESDLKPAVTAGLLLGSAFGVIYAMSIVRGAYDPWLSSRRAVPLYPLIEAAFWATLFSLAAAVLGVARVTTDRVSQKCFRAPAIVIYGALAALIGVLLVKSEWRSSVLAIVPLGRIGLFVFAFLLGLAATRVRPVHQQAFSGRVTLLTALVPLGAAAGLLLIVGLTERSGSGAGAASDRARPNIILISVDALRSDSVRFMSESAPPTPSMDQVAESGVVFSAAFVQAPWTLPSFASMMTSRYPSEVGIALIDEVPGNAYPLSDEATTLAELLSDSGYACVAQLTNPFLTSKYSVCRGFREVRHSQDPRPYMQRVVLGLVRRFRDRRAGHDARGVTRGAIAWLRERRREPFFMWVHYLDPQNRTARRQTCLGRGPSTMN